MNRFPRVLGVRAGYDPDQVDALIRRIEGTLGRGSLDGEPITADEIRDARFRTKLGGYNEMAVDFALEAFIVAVETRAAGNGGPVPVRPRPAPQPPPSSAAEDPWPGSALSADVPASAGASPVSGGPASAGAAPVAGGPPTAGAPSPADASPPAGDSGPAGSGPAAGDAWAGDLPAEGEEVSAEWPGRLPTPEEQAAWIERAAFRAGRLGMGYNEDQVDAFLDRVVATLRGTTDQPVTPGDVRAARFATVMLRPGYAVGEVDEFLTGVADVLEAHLSR
ncbi:MULTISPECIES: DivIVA domain-containing protein [Streptosporangium]|uniref:DivIVA domain-containing protein n=1 Tax=Streptosporangium brasiliense TaxID=47480 RepID=A0ABT9QVE9_9ACTN|nr:DivIVA domain-containing protein [Streptosporangium brasiliense]MDP9860952.1 DivIVA domain-containing protein [Streptosporangium brasiliense]